MNHLAQNRPIAASSAAFAPSVVPEPRVPAARIPRELPANVRLLHAPRVPAPVAGTQGTLALDFEAVSAPPRPRVERLRSKSLDGDTQRWIATYLQAAVEVAHGHRPAAQLVRHTALEIHGALTRRGSRAQHTARHQALRTPASPRPGKEPRPSLAALFPVPQGESAIEVAARFWAGERQRALAARFERRGARWICVALDFA